MKQFNWEEFKNRDNYIAVHCKTEEEADDFCKQMHKHDMIWSRSPWEINISYLEETYWKVHKAETTYSNNGAFASKTYYENENYTILEWSDYMKEFNWEEFKDKNNQIAIHCKTEEEADDFCKQIHKHGMKWCDGDSYLNKTNWETYKTETMYSNKGAFSSKTYYKNEGYTILEWSYYMNNLTINLENVSDADKETIMGIIKKSEHPKRWRAERAKIYYYVSDNGSVLKHCDFCDTSDDFRFNTGNYFGTEEQAKEYKKKLLTQQKYKDMSDVTAKDWETSSINKYLPWYNNITGCIDTYVIFTKNSAVCFSSVKKAQEAVEAIGEDNFKKYILEIAD